MADSIYLDYNATCPMDSDVQQAVKFAMKALWANPSSMQGGGKACKAAIEEAREMVAKMVSASPDEITFTSGGTEANNMVIYSALEEYQRYLVDRANPIVEGNGIAEPIPHIITTNIEHPSISKLLDHLESKSVCRVTRIPVDHQTGAVSEFEVMDAIRPNTCLITIMWANNETGVLQPVVEVSELLQDVNGERVSNFQPPIRLHTDAAQAIGKLRVDVRAGGGVDFLTIVGHKFYGPRNGAVFVRRDQGVRLHPVLFGGGQENGIRPGTENTPMIVGLGKAAEIVVENLNNFTADMKDIRTYLETRLVETFHDDVSIHYAHVGKRLPNTSSVAFTQLPVPASELLASCRRLIASTGAACHSGSTRPSAVLLACGISHESALRTVRFSVGRETTKLEIEEAINELRSVIDDLYRR